MRWGKLYKIEDAHGALGYFCRSDDVATSFNLLCLVTEYNKLSLLLLVTCSAIGSASDFFCTSNLFQKKKKIIYQSKSRVHRIIISSLFLYHCLRQCFPTRLTTMPAHRITAHGVKGFKKKWNILCRRRSCLHQYNPCAIHMIQQV